MREREGRRRKDRYLMYTEEGLHVRGEREREIGRTNQKIVVRCLSLNCQVQCLWKYLCHATTFMTNWWTKPSRPYSKSICTTKCGIAPLLQIDMHHLPGLEPGAFSM